VSTFISPRPDHHRKEWRTSLPSEGEALRNLHRPAVSGAITAAMPMTAATTEELKAIVITANRVAREFNGGELATCIGTSYALAAALTDLGYADARPVRVEAASFPDDRELQHVILGSLRPSPRAGYFEWKGHLAVCIGQSCDAGIGVEPVAASLTPDFLDLDLPKHQRQLWVPFSAVCTRYLLAPQKGFARTGDAKPWAWGPLANEITAAIRGLKQIAIPEAHRGNWQVPRDEEGSRAGSG
jgi:hypothetical protein